MFFLVFASLACIHMMRGDRPDEFGEEWEMGDERIPPSRLTKSQLDNIPTAKYMSVLTSDTTNMAENEEEGVIMSPLSSSQLQCAICISEFNEGEEVRNLPCGHMFHIGCIDEWLGLNVTCPLCKQDVRVTTQPHSSQTETETVTALERKQNHEYEMI